MYNMEEFYSFHGIGRVKFAKMVGVTYSTLMMYESGYRISDEARLRIEIGMDIMEGYALRYHQHINGAESGLYAALKNENDYMDNMFKKHFKRVILVEL